MNRDVVIVRAGRDSTHPTWGGGAGRPFDLIVAAYEVLAPAQAAGDTEYMVIPGRKVAGWRELFRQRPDLLHRYEQFALIDDDIACSESAIAAAFDAGRRHALSLWQPSLTWSSYFSYAFTLHNPVFDLRYVNFIEMMCPFFRRDHLARALPLFDLGLETGIDRLWCKLEPKPFKAFAVLDNVQVTHSRPVGVNSKAQGFAGAKDPYRSAIAAMEARLDIHFRGPVAYAGTTRHGIALAGRLPMAALSLVTLMGWRRTVNAGWFYKPIMDHARHILTRPVDNATIDLSRVRAHLDLRTDHSAGA